jgi:polysaccharide chain length determinant protein (PEP-CTERM system associated)
VIPGKKYRPEDYVEIAWRRRWVVVLPFALMAVGTFLWSQSLPNRYRSQALVLVVPPQVGENFVQPTVTESLQERLQAMRQQILSRTRLERIITDFDLYPRERKQLLMDQVIDQMRRDVRVDVAKAVVRRAEPGSFTVSYESENPKTAMLVTERVASLFVRENIEGRSTQADATIQFLQSQVDEAARKLQEQEAKIEAFRRENAGHLPSEVDSNLQAAQSTRQELQALTEELNRDRDRQLVIERTIADEMAISALTSAGSVNGENASTQSAAQQLAAAQAQLSTMRLRLKEDHPDLRALRRRIGELQQKAAAEALQQPVSEGGPVASLDVAGAARQRRLSGLRAEFESLGRNIALKRAQSNKLQAVLAEYTRRAQAAPALESQMAQLTRGDETLRESYTTLLKKAQAANIASNLEQRQVGEQFRIVDPARIPELPATPNRVRMNLIGMSAGLGIGLLFAGFLEYRDTSLRSEEDVLVALALPVIALVPTMWTAAEERHRSRRRRLLISSSTVATICFVAVALVWKLGVFENWIR